MNKYTETVIAMTSQKADEMIIALWDDAYNDAMAATFDIPIRNIEELRSGIVAITLNKFEDLLREELGIISRVPEGEE